MFITFDLSAVDRDHIHVLSFQYFPAICYQEKLLLSFFNKKEPDNFTSHHYSKRVEIGVL